MCKLRPLLAILLVASTTTVSGCIPPDEPLEAHVLNRIGYGPDAWSRARIRQLGIQAYVEEQLNPETIDDGSLAADLALRYPTLALDLATLRNVYNEYVPDPAMGLMRPRQELAEAKVLRDVRSHRQLEQVLVDFWMNHFNVDARNEIARWAVVTYERDAIRPYVLGKFRDMLRATARHPAMLEYLDNNLNFIEGYYRSPKFYGPNENYAREILELHTVTPAAGYTLQDIQEVARAFTGWTTPKVYLAGDTGFLYLHDGHDTGVKHVMGQLQIPAGGNTSDGEAVIDFLSRHPATAQHIARKLCERFVSENPPSALVQAAATIFLLTDGDLRQVMRTILTSAQFQSISFARSKTKRPHHYVASLARSVGVSNEALFASQAVSQIRAMGEELYAAAPPTGYPDRSSAWRGEGAFLLRTNLATAATTAQLGFGPPLQAAGATPAAQVGDLERRLVHGGLSATTRDRAVTLFAGLPAPAQIPYTASVLLSSPEFLTH
jgi:uncharacterized protein (DUF1800 family)